MRIGIITGSAPTRAGFAGAGLSRSRPVRARDDHRGNASPASTCCTSRAISPATRGCHSQVTHQANIAALRESRGGSDPRRHGLWRDRQTVAARLADRLRRPALPRQPAGRRVDLHAAHRARPKPAAGTGSSSSPSTPALRAALLAGASEAGLEARDGGCYGHVDGPRFNTKAEIRTLAAAGVTAVSQTAGPETVLAGEAEIPFALLGYATDYANGVVRRGGAGGGAGRASSRPARRRLRRDARRCVAACRARELAPVGSHVPLRLSRTPLATRPRCARRADRAALRAWLGPERRRRAAGRVARARAGLGARRRRRRRATAARDRRRAARAVAGHDGPVLLVAPDVPALSAVHLAAVRDDLADGVLLSSAATGDGTPFLVALSHPEPELLALVGAPFNDILTTAARLGGTLGMLRAERRLSSVGDARALQADPITPPDLRALLTPATDAKLANSIRRILFGGGVTAARRPLAPCSLGSNSSPPVVKSRLPLAFRPVTSFTAVVMAAGQGTRMRSATPKVLHEICGRPMVAWPVVAAQEAGAERVVVVSSPNVDLDRRAARTARAPRSSRCPTAPAAPCSPRCRDVAPGARWSSSPATCRWCPPQAIQQLVDAHVASGAAATMATDDPRRRHRLRPRRARRATGHVVRVVETKAPGDATAEELAIREINTGIFCFDQRRARRCARRASAPTTPRARSTCPTSSRSCAIDGESSPPTSSTTTRSCSASTIASTLADVTRARPAPDPRGPHARRRDDRRPRLDAASTPASRSARTRRSSPARCACKGAARTIGDDAARQVLLRATARRSRTASRVGPFAYLRPAPSCATARRRHVRRDQELRHRRGHEGPAPELHRRRRRRRRQQPRRRHDHRQLRQQVQDKHRTTIGAGVKTAVDTTLVAPVSVGDGAWTAAGSVDHRGRTGPVRSASRARGSATSRATRTASREGPGHR